MYENEENIDDEVEILEIDPSNTSAHMITTAVASQYPNQFQFIIWQA